MTNKKGAGSRATAKVESFEQKMAELSLQAVLSWLSGLDSRFYSMSYLMMFMKLIATPGMKRSELALFIEINCRLSRSTAERLISAAADEGYIVIENPKERPGYSISLSQSLYSHFSEQFKLSVGRAKRISELASAAAARSRQ